MKKGKPIQSVNGEIPLPEAMIQHIQSFMSGKEAAQTTILSKQWYHAWLTRPTLDLDDRNFDRQSSRKFSSDKFCDFANKTMQRYQDLSLKIESFILRMDITSYLCTDNDIYHNYVDKLIVNALKIGATHLQLQFYSNYLIVPQEVLASQTLLKLSLRFCRFDGNYVVRCSNLKSLSLTYGELKSVDVFDNIISCNTTSLEELSLTSLGGLSLSRMNLYDLHKLRRLFLSQVDVGTIFASGFASRFPCLNDLSIIRCRECKKIQIASSSLQTISFKPMSGSWRAKFDVPNIRKFIYSGSSSPSDQLSIKATPSTEWEFDVSISCNQFYKISWFLKLKKYLSKFRLSRMSLSIKLSGSTIHHWKRDSEHEVDINEGVPKHPLVVENLTIDVPPSYCCALLVRLFGICRPKFITHYWSCHDWRHENVSLGILCKRLITPDGGIPDQSMFGQFNLKKVNNVEVYEMFDAEWRPLLLEEPLDATKTPVNERKVRFELIYGLIDSDARLS